MNLDDARSWLEYVIENGSSSEASPEGAAAILRELNRLQDAISRVEALCAEYEEEGTGASVDTLWPYDVRGALAEPSPPVGE